MGMTSSGSFATASKLCLTTRPPSFSMWLPIRSNKASLNFFRPGGMNRAQSFASTISDVPPVFFHPGQAGIHLRLALSYEGDDARVVRQAIVVDALRPPRLMKTVYPRVRPDLPRVGVRELVPYPPLVIGKLVERHGVSLLQREVGPDLRMRSGPQQHDTAVEGVRVYRISPFENFEC